MDTDFSISCLTPYLHGLAVYRVMQDGVRKAGDEPLCFVALQIGRQKERPRLRGGVCESMLRSPDPSPASESGQVRAGVGDPERTILCDHIFAKLHVPGTRLAPARSRLFGQAGRHVPGTFAGRFALPPSRRRVPSPDARRVVSANRKSNNASRSVKTCSSWVCVLLRSAPFVFQPVDEPKIQVILQPEAENIWFAERPILVHGQSFDRLCAN